MYKDKSRQRLANKAIKQKARAKGVTRCDKGVTEHQGVIQVDAKGVTLRPPYNTGQKGVPEFARSLPELTIKNVLDVLYHRGRLGLFDDSKKRWERAVIYHEWDMSGRPVAV